MVFATPLPDGLAGITIAKEGGDQTGQEKGQIVAQTVPTAGVRHGRKDLMDTQEMGILQQLLSLLIG
jgi:hypothetical protein